MEGAPDEATRVAAAASGTAYAVVVPAPAPGPGSWAGAPSAALDDDGGFVVAYRVRTPESRGSATVVGLAPDGERLTPVVRLEKERFGAESLERPALVRTEAGQWRLYVSCATPGSKHWRIDVLEAGDPAGLQSAEPRTAFAGDTQTGVKDPVVRRTAREWQAWVCCHPLDVAGEEDRMVTRYATSEDGLTWRWRGVALRGRAGSWDARGARVTAVLPDGSATYDGRASTAENFSERTGTAVPGAAPGELLAVGDAPVSEVRYLAVVPLPDLSAGSGPSAPTGRYRLFYEAPLADGSHELRTRLVTEALPARG
ncbi:hypothetical protein [Terrabacter sp. NPDC080008]|uniref:hypothetical protein n=1 Tax=Terrabacter sp. NPDC080008 TaxID=3155176 RepID=UPI00344F172B